MKVKVGLFGVQESLVFCLWARAKLSKTDNPVLIYSKAIELVENVIEYDFNRLEGHFPLNTYIATLVRARMFDDTIRGFTAEHPKATIVNLGAGLDTTFFRVDNGSIKWYDLDLPDVIEIRNRVIPENDRMKCVAKSLLDTSWMGDIKDIRSGILFLVGGVLYYFEEKEMIILLSKLADCFPEGEIIFDVMSPFTMSILNMAIKRAGANMSVKWGIDDTKAISKWDRRIVLLEDYTLFSRLKNKKYWGEEEARRIDFFERNRGSCIVHLKFR